MSLDIQDRLKLDWLSFTYKVDPDQLEDGLCEFDYFLLDFPQIEKHLQDALILNRSRFYEHVLQVDKNIMISYCDEDKSGFGQGVNVSIPGSGLAILYDWFDLPKDGDTLLALFQHLKAHHCQISRIDIAYDDFDKIITPFQYAKWKIDKNMVTRYCKCQFVACDSEKGSTFYLGSRKSGKMLRIYDKDYESKGEIKSIRYEFELRREFGRMFFDWILEGNNFIFEEYLLSWFDIKDFSSNKNRTQAPRLKEFQDFLEKSIFIRKMYPDELVPCSIPRTYSSPTFDRKMQWVRNCTLRNLKLFVNSFGFQHLIDCLDDIELNEYDYYLLKNKQDALDSLDSS